MLDMFWTKRILSNYLALESKCNKISSIIRDALLKQPKGDRAFVELLMLAGEAGLDALTMACELTLEGGVVNAPIVMNELRRLVAPPLPAASINVPDRIALTLEPLANCQRYDHLLGATYVH